MAQCHLALNGLTATLQEVSSAAMISSLPHRKFKQITTELANSQNGRHHPRLFCWVLECSRRELSSSLGSPESTRSTTRHSCWRFSSLTICICSHLPAHHSELPSCGVYSECLFRTCPVGIIQCQPNTTEITRATWKKQHRCSVDRGWNFSTAAFSKSPCRAAERK